MCVDTLHKGDNDDDNNNNNCLRDLFIGSFQVSDFSIKEGEELINIAIGSTFKAKVSTVSLSSFWARLTEE